MARTKNKTKLKLFLDKEKPNQEIDSNQSVPHDNNNTKSKTK